MLYRQESWVAHDEMSFYLALLTYQNECASHAPLVFTGLPCQFHQWVSVCLGIQVEWVVSAILADHHWIPVVFQKTHDDAIQIFTTREGFQLFRCEYQIPDKMQVQVITMPSLFSADCGFQTVGWILKILTVPEVRFRSCIVGSPISPLTTNEAVTLRTLFEHQLWATPRAQQTVIPKQIAMGGALRESVEQSLHLLKSHGVPSGALEARVEVVLEKLGRASVSKAVRSAKSWAELKHLANNVSPRLQLVLPSELAQVVRERVEKGKPFGDKQRKHQAGSKSSEPLQLNPEDITIPEGIFKMGQDQVIRQIALGSLCKDAQGIVVVTSAQAQPYIRLQQPMSQAGLALLILDHSDPSCIGSGCLVRFPAKFESTGEPLIATARIVQLGCVEISRHLPAQQLKVDEVPTSVIRVLCFRDELPGEWNDFVGHPVKYIMDHTEAFMTKTASESTVIDVFDRQFVNHRMERRQPKHADTFLVSIRVTGIQIESVLTKSGQMGLYYEPRSSDGRSPHESYRVVWLPKTAKPDALTSQQTSEQWSCLARNGAKFGLRIRDVDAKEVHDHYKPFVPYLDGTSLNTLVVGPFGFGVTKQGLVKLFAQWKWAARPCQPRGKSTDGAGMLWEVQAQERPAFEVYTLEHGDVLISMVDKKKPPVKPKSDILAPTRTLDVLKARTVSGKDSSSQSEDGLQKNDPWASFVPSSKVQRVAPTLIEARHATAQVEAIQANVDKKVAATLAQFEQKMLEPRDAAMDAPGLSRLDELEHRMNAIESTMQCQQAQHQQHQNHVAAQFTQLQQQVDAQGHSLQRHLDEKMQEQLGQIERLLGRGDKKARQEWQVLGGVNGSHVTFSGSLMSLHRQSWGCTAKAFRACSNIRILTLPWFIAKFVFLMLCIRVGEAANPGPQGTPFHLGTVNPTGLLGKGEVVSHLPRGAWGVTETHLTIPGVKRFRTELQFADGQWHFHATDHAPLTSNAMGCVGGKAVGVGLLSSFPSRNLQCDFDTSVRKEARIHAAAVCVNGIWVKFGTFYGYAYHAKGASCSVRRF